MSESIPGAGFPAWLTLLSSVSLAVAAICAAIVLVDVARRPLKMAVMNLVWPLATLFGSLAWLAMFRTWARSPRPDSDSEDKTPFPISVAKGASHCGAGCTLGDIIAEWSAFFVPSIAVALGWKSLFGEKMFAVWILDFLVAFAIGIAFQYFAIKPMRDLSVGAGIKQALKADIASITSWQVGMYGGMAAIQFAWFRPRYGMIAPVNSPEFWFAMQLAMLAGFCTAYPVNWMLIRAGVKEAM